MSYSPDKLYEITEELLAICIYDGKKSVYVLSQVKEDDIILADHKEIYKAIANLHKQDMGVDLITVSNELSEMKQLKNVGGRKKITEMVESVVTTSNYKTYIELLFKELKKYKAYQLANNLKNSIDTGVEEVNDVIIETSKELTKIMSCDNKNNSSHLISESAMEAYDRFESVFNSKNSIGLQTQYPKFNRLTGGFQKGMLYIIGGRSNMGKSILLSNFAEFIARRKNVVIFSLEMKATEYAQRIMLGRAGIDVERVNNCELREEDFQKMTNQLEYMSDLKLIVEDKTPCTLQDIEVGIINCIAKQGSCDLVCIDYLQLIKPTNRYRGSREQEVAEISNTLKSLAGKYSVPIIALAQLSRQLESREDKRPMMSDLRESGAIEQDADLVAFVYRDEYYYPNKIECKGKAELLIRKQRNGRLGNINMVFNGSRCYFKEREEYGN